MITSAEISFLIPLIILGVIDYIWGEVRTEVLILLLLPTLYGYKYIVSMLFPLLIIVTVLALLGIVLFYYRMNKMGLMDIVVPVTFPVLIIGGDGLISVASGLFGVYVGIITHLMRIYKDLCREGTPIIPISRAEVMVGKAIEKWYYWDHRLDVDMSNEKLKKKKTEIFSAGGDCVEVDIVYPLVWIYMMFTIFYLLSGYIT